MDENHPRIAIDTLVVDKNGRVLLQLLKKSPKAGYWSIPGRQGESLKDLETAIIEELSMELKADIQLTGFLCTTDSNSKNKGRVALPIYMAEAISEQVYNNLQGAVEDIRWFHLSELPKKLTSNSITAIKNYYSKYVAKKSPEEQAIEELKALCSDADESAEQDQLADATELTLADMEENEAFRRTIERPIPSELSCQLFFCFDSAEEEKRTYKIELTFNPDKTFEIKHLQPKAMSLLMPDIRMHIFLIVWHHMASKPKPRYINKIVKEMESGMWGRNDKWTDLRKRCLGCTKYLEPGRKKLYCSRNCGQEFSEFLNGLPTEANGPERKKIQELIIEEKIAQRLIERWVPPN